MLRILIEHTGPMFTADVDLGGMGAKHRRVQGASFYDVLENIEHAYLDMTGAGIAGLGRHSFADLQAIAQVTANSTEAATTAQTAGDVSLSLEQSDKEAAAVAVAPRVTLADIKAAIKYRFDINAGASIGALEGHIVERDGSSSKDALDLLSICILVTQTGFTLIGKSAPASPENFNADLGKKIAYEDAVRQLWPLMGFALRERWFAATASATQAAGEETAQTAQQSSEQQ